MQKPFFFFGLFIGLMFSPQVCLPDDSMTERDLVSFQDGNPFDTGVVTEDGQSLRFDGEYIALDQKMDWSDYDYLKMDMDLVSREPLNLSVEIHDGQTRGYWTRVNYLTIIPPGKSTLTIPLRQLFVGEKSRPGRNLLLGDITRLIINAGVQPAKGALTINRLYLERDQTTKDTFFDSLHAFDLGTETSPVMEGFTRITPGSRYREEQGYGFLGSGTHRAHDARQPEPLYQDFIIVQSGDFAIDLPDGKYRVMVNIDSPGGYWGENQVYRHRTIKVNGVPVVEESLDFDKYNEDHYRFWKQDDMPWENTFDKYQKTTYHEKIFDATVTGGQLRIGFESDNMGCCVSAIVVFPVDRAEEGEKFLQYLESKRRFHFDNYFKRILPSSPDLPLKATDDDRARGYVAFSRSYMQDVDYPGIPREGEILGELNGSAFAGEYEPVTLSLVPFKNLGRVVVTASDLVHTETGMIPASAIDIGYVSYRLSRVTMEGSVYTIAPRLIMPWNTVDMPEGITRRFWLTVKTPVDCKPGLYAGTVSVKAEHGGSLDIPIRFLVRKGALDPIDIPVGPFGHAVHTSWRNDDQGDAFSQLLLHKSLAKLREYGFNCATGLPRITYRGFKDGKPDLDFREADQSMKLLRELGFTAFMTYGGGIRNLDTYYQDADAMKAAGFDDYTDFIRAVYSAVEEHARENDWIRLYYYLADEPIGEDLIRSAENAEFYRNAFPAGPPFFTGASSFVGDDPEDPHFRLSRALHVVSWNTHDETGVNLLRDAGGHWAFYNGGNRWTFGDYMFKCVREYDMKFRTSWHFNACAGNPYYALDCREDDYAWCNSSPEGDLIPSVEFERIREGIEDYRRLQTLERLAREKNDANGLHIIESRMRSFQLGQRDHDSVFPESDWKHFREKTDQAIEMLCHGQ